MSWKPFLIYCGLALCMLQCSTEKNDDTIVTVNGPIASSQIGKSLIHEHIMVDFIGADEISEQRWDRAEVIKVVLPYLKRIKMLGCNTFVECTPNYLGRDPLLLKALSDSTGLNIITNTGYYGARNNKFLPPHAFSETANQLAERWIAEWENGIDGTGVKPGFIKIGVDRGSLSEIHQKLIAAAAKTHLKTGLTIASHTGTAIPAFEQVEILKKEGVAPAALIWVHAQAEKDLKNHLLAAREGVWISLDGVRHDNLEEYLKMIKNLKLNGLLQKVLVSHDAGWYSPGEENGGKFRGYTSLFNELIPLLKEENFSEPEINQLLIDNPRQAFEIKIRENK